METKIKIKSVKIKKQTDKWTIREIETEDGKKYDCFDDLKEGQEYLGTITPNENEKYNAIFKLKKDNNKTFPKKDWTTEKKICALNNAVNLCSAGIIKIDKLNEARDKFFEWLK